MIDGYLVLTPLLILGVVALFGFVGCAQIIGVDEWEGDGEGGNGDTPLGPTNLVAVPGDSRVDLSWDDYANATEYHVKRGSTSGQYDDMFPVGAQSPTYADTLVVNDKTYYYVVSAIFGGGETQNSEETPPVTPTAPFVPGDYFITSETLGLLSNTFNGYAGMEILIGANALQIHEPGRFFTAGNVLQHDLRIIDKITLADVAKVTLDTVGGTDGKFQYMVLPRDIILNPDSSYYIVSSEIAGGDSFYQDDTTVQTTSAAMVVNSIYGDGVLPWVAGLQPFMTFGPLDFQYSVVP